MLKRESLTAMARRWRKALGDAKCGPLLVASEVVNVADSWDQYSAEADGMKCSDWLKKATGKYAPFWRGRLCGLEMLGESARRNIHHDVVNYVARHVPPEFVTEVRDLLLTECRANHGHPIEYNVACSKIRPIIGLAGKAPTKLCRRCRKLEALLREHGIDVPE